ncbi:hypothetical protein A8B74_01675 [Sulfitobacter geojensis]|nr:hypothetical protein A8B74_01675 [Sulfitobacter geojensis]
MVKRLIVDFRYHAARLDDPASVESVIKLAGTLSESAKKLSSFLDEREVKNVAPVPTMGKHRNGEDLGQINNLLDRMMSNKDCLCSTCKKLTKM